MDLTPAFSSNQQSLNKSPRNTRPRKTAFVSRHLLDVKSKLKAHRRLALGILAPKHGPWQLSLSQTWQLSERSLEPQY
jgi:hypothetical protein